MSDIDHEIEIPEITSTQEQQEQPLPSQQAQLRPDSVFYDESYTYATRDRELSLLENLLTSQIENVRMERALIRHALTSRTQN